MSKKVSGWPLIVPKEVDTSITGDQVMEALAADVEASDSGKVLTAVYGGLEGEEKGSVMWASPLPFIGEGDAGKVLTVNAGETGAEWAEPSGGGGGIIIATEENSVLSLTYAQVDEAVENGTYIVLKKNFGGLGLAFGGMLSYGVQEGTYAVAFKVSNEQVVYTGSSESGPLTTNG